MLKSVAGKTNIRPLVMDGDNLQKTMPPKTWHIIKYQKFFQTTDL